ncbi:alpha/beta-hydrolase [Coprinellus micaceus]|uniref:Alpha/beta-hydrolase n=1 Tax=Coprinellus micaceus TaxID=71717 RepID=A0A4Y7T795_COPMI|nr:alpha/beta-hydrolase [Coprinellus micaceus]
MPFISVSCPSGTHDFWYSISTPNSTSTESIDPDLSHCPVFESQFTDPELRQFNLLAVDLLGSGATKGAIGDRRYTPEETAADLQRVLDALNMPPLHIMGLSIGGTIALNLASTHPQRVLSLTICSPLTPTEPEEVVAGREQVFGRWAEVFSEDEAADEEEMRKRHEVLNEITLGATELLHNYVKTPLETASWIYSTLKNIQIYSGSPENLQNAKHTSIRWFTDREPLSSESLAKISCPITIIYCTSDVGYPLENAQDLERTLQEAGLKTKLYQVPGPHYGTLAGAEEINPILRDTVLAASKTYSPRGLPKPDFAPSGKMRTPWTRFLMRYGYHPDGTPSHFVHESWFTMPRDDIFAD